MCERRTIVFVCEHGAAKSVLAAALLERLASEASVPLRALARGTQPDPDVSPAAAAGLLAEGIDVRGWRPRRLTASDLAPAWRVVSFGPQLSDVVAAGVPLERWEVPHVADGFAAATEAMLDGLRELVDEASRARRGGH